MNFSQLGFGFFVLKINGLLLAAAFLFCAWHYYRHIKRKRFSVDFFVHHFWRWMIAGLVLGRITALLFDIEIFERHGWLAPAVFWDGEVDPYGVIIGALAMMGIDFRKEKESLWKWIDLAVPSVMIFVLLMDFIQFFTGAVYGTETTLSWGIRYETFGVETLAPVHPVTLYAVIPHIILLNWALRKQKLWERQPGRLSLMTILFAFSVNFFLLYLRGGEQIMILDALSLNQILSLLVVIGAVVGLRMRRSYVKK